MRHFAGTPSAGRPVRFPSATLIGVLVMALARAMAQIAFRRRGGNDDRTRTARSQRGAVELTTVLLLAGGIAAATLLVVEILTGKVTELASGIPTQ